MPYGKPPFAYSLLGVLVCPELTTMAKTSAASKQFLTKRRLRLRSAPEDVDRALMAFAVTRSEDNDLGA